MPLHPEAEAFIAQTEGRTSMWQLPLEQSRIVYNTAVAMLAGPPEAVAEVRDLSAPGPGGPIPIRLYRPETPRPPIFVFLHGGGWRLGGLESHGGPARAICNRSGWAVAAVDYRLAPENRFPAALDDTLAAALWLRDSAPELGLDGSRIAIGGDSAGGNLAAAACIAARDRGGPRFGLQVLIYPGTLAGAQTVSRRENSHLLAPGDIGLAEREYVDDPREFGNPLVSPLLAPDLSRLPDALVITGEYDPLRDEGEEYAHRLREAGSEVSLTRYEGMVHGFFQMGAIMADGRRSIEEIAAALRAKAAGPSP